MRSPAAQILETALALQRAPGERFRLRERPLPAGVVHAIEIAAGSPAAVQSAAAELAEQEATLVEAARFYLEQVLFADPDATAYRVLGLAPDATQEAIRTHHRWLQRWLHPDRAQAGDASVFATRVNQAFAQLRSPESRHAYDVRLAEARIAEAAATLSPETVRHWEHDDEAPRYGRRSRWLLAAALLACAVLAVLIVRNPERSVQWAPADGHDGVAQQDTGPAIEDRDLGVLSAALTVDQARVPEVVQPEAEEPAGAGSPRAVEPAGTGTPPAMAPASLRRPLGPTSVASSATTAPARRPPSPAVEREPATRPPQLATPLPSAAALTADKPPASAAPPEPVPPARAAPPTPPAPAIRTEDATLVAARLPMAEQRVAQLAGYLASQHKAVPLWDNVHAMTETNLARDRINARKGSRIELGRPVWRMRPEQATFNTDYRCRKDDGGSCKGSLEVTLVWREGLWLVRGVSIGPSA